MLAGENIPPQPTKVTHFSQTTKFMVVEDNKSVLKLFCKEIKWAIIRFSRDRLIYFFARFINIVPF